MFSLNLLCVTSAILCVAQSTLIIAPKPLPPPINQCSKCNIWDKCYVWAIEDGTCRIFQNICLLEEENADRKIIRKKPLKPISEIKCKRSAAEFCPMIIDPVAAEFPLTAECGCNGKPGNISIQVFGNPCLLRKFSVNNNKPYLAASKWSTKLC